MDNKEMDSDVPISRRVFLKYTGAAMAMTMVGLPGRFDTHSSKKRYIMGNIRIRNVQSNFERIPLNPYRFKGGASTEMWNAIACMESETGTRKIGLGPQGVLWSDASVAAAHSEAGGNALMYSVSERALQMLKGESFKSPVQLLDDIFPDVYGYAKEITRIEDLSKTFALNALVCVDNAAWLLYAAENDIRHFDEMIPEPYRPGLSHKHEGVASMPSFPSGTPIGKVNEAAEEGYFIMKLKIGAAGTQQEMLEKDKEFLTAVHNALGDRRTSYTKNGRIPYYLDANGRYEKKETLLKLLDHAKKIGAFDHIAVIEEPFPEHNNNYVDDMGVRVAADERAHTVEEAKECIELGYTAFAVKAIAKTLSMTMKITQLAYEHDIPCFCADLTVSPILLEWNKNIAARLKPLPELTVGLQEANGHQYYKDWDKQMSYHPMPEAEWVEPQKGIYHTGESFYEHSGGIFKPSNHYEALFKNM
ncbi:enolase C-terminal domain-like protein [Fodinibius roseus]|nr:enolase C-terminal domain-like protein [Fodinibius roseus]